MRRVLGVFGVVILLLATPSDGWSFHFRHRLYRGGLAGPFSFGVNLPGGYGFQIDTSGQQQQQQQQQPPADTPPAAITIDSDIQTKASALPGEVSAGIDRLNALTDKINNRHKDNKDFKAFTAIEKSGTEATKPAETQGPGSEIKTPPPPRRK